MTNPNTRVSTTRSRLTTADKSAVRRSTLDEKIPLDILAENGEVLGTFHPTRREWSHYVALAAAAGQTVSDFYSDLVQAEFDRRLGKDWNPRG